MLSGPLLIIIHRHQLIVYECTLTPETENDVLTGSPNSEVTNLITILKTIWDIPKFATFVLIYPF